MLSGHRLLAVPREPARCWGRGPHQRRRARQHGTARRCHPIAWVAVGDPAQVLSPDQHEKIWAIQRDLDFEGTVYGATDDTSFADVMAQQAQWYGRHRGDQVADERLR